MKKTDYKKALELAKTADSAFHQKLITEMNVTQRQDVCSAFLHAEQLLKEAEEIMHMGYNDDNKAANEWLSKRNA